MQWPTWHNLDVANTYLFPASDVINGFVAMSGYRLAMMPDEPVAKGPTVSTRIVNQKCQVRIQQEVLSQFEVDFRAIPNKDEIKQSEA